MKKDTLLEIILGTIGGLIFAVGMCMCLIKEWNLFKAGVVVSIVGFIILLCIIPVYRSNHPKKAHGKINWEIVFTWIIGVVGALIMGFGISLVLCLRVTGIAIDLLEIGALILELSLF